MTQEGERNAAIAAPTSFVTTEPDGDRCAACGVLTGARYATKALVREPYGRELVCLSCYDALKRRKLTVHASLIAEGRRKVEVPELIVPRKRGRPSKEMLEMRRAYEEELGRRIQAEIDRSYAIPFSRA